MSGRPTLYTAEIADRILDALTRGCSLNSACGDDAMPQPSTVLDWVREDRESFCGALPRGTRRGHALMARFTLYTPLIADLILRNCAAAAR